MQAMELYTKNICFDIFMLQKANKIVIFFLVLLVIFFVPYSLLEAQNNSFQVIDKFEIKNESVAAAIEKLSVKTGMNFSFNAADEQLKKKITYTAENKTVSTVLNDILTPVNRSFKQIGNQIVIFVPRKPAATKKRSKETNKTDNARKTNPANGKQATLSVPLTDTVRIIDTLLLVDTVTFRDTLVIRDTLVKTDTVFVSKKRNKRKKTKSFPPDYFNRQERREAGWAGSLFFTPLLTSFTFADEPEPLSLRSFSLGGSVDKLSKKWTWGVSVRFTRLANRFRFTQTVTEGGYYEPDTLDVYYTIVDNDTNWFYVTDSVYLPLNSYTTDYDRTNRIGYLDISLEATYTLYAGSKLRAHLLGGMGSSFPVYKKGVYAADKTNDKWIDFAELTFTSPLISLQAGGGLKYRITTNIDVSGDLIYTYYFGPALAGQDNKIKTNTLGLRIGMVYCFK